MKRIREILGKFITKYTAVQSQRQFGHHRTTKANKLGISWRGIFIPYYISKRFCAVIPEASHIDLMESTLPVYVVRCEHLTRS